MNETNSTPWSIQCIIHWLEAVRWRFIILALEEASLSVGLLHCVVVRSSPSSSDQDPAGLQRAGMEDVVHVVSRWSFPVVAILRQ